jgi:ABC-type Fe3+ transport system permease subunit
MEDNNNNNIADSLENERYSSELERDRRKWQVRRRMAIASFIALVLFAVYYAVIGWFVTGEQAEAISSFNSIVIAVIGALTSLVLGYFGSVLIEDNLK